jgi:hypothetical protein
MNDYQFDAIYAEMKKQTELLAAISRANRWAAFSDEELNEIILNTCMLDQDNNVTKILEPGNRMQKEIDAELARRKAEHETHH